jgi:hypothetical protein
MTSVFSFFLRLFFCFVAAKFLLRALELDSVDYLLGLTAIFLANVYLFDYLEYRDRLVFFRRREQGGKGPHRPQR